MIIRKLWSLIALGISFLFFALIGYDLSQPQNWTHPAIAGIGVYFLGLLVFWGVKRVRGEP